MSIKVDHKRSLSEINLKPKNERKSTLSASSNNLSTKKQLKKMSLTPPPNKRSVFKDIEPKINNNRKSMEVNLKTSLRGSFNNNKYIKKGSVKKNEFLIQDETTFSSKKTDKNSNSNSINNTISNCNNAPISHRLNNKNYLALEVGIKELDAMPLDKLKKISQNLAKKSDSHTNLTSSTTREKTLDKTNNKSNASLNSATRSKLNSLLYNNSRFKQSLTPQPQKRETYKRTSQSNNNLLKNEDISKIEEKPISQREKSNKVIQCIEDPTRRSISPFNQSSNVKNNILQESKKDSFLNMNGKLKASINEIKSSTRKSTELDKKKTVETVEITNNLNIKSYTGKKNQLTDEGNLTSSSQSSKPKETAPKQSVIQTVKKLDFKELNTSPLLKGKKSTDSEETLLLQIKNNPVLQNIIQTQKKEAVKQELTKSNPNSGSSPLLASISVHQKPHIIKKTIKNIQEFTKTGFDGEATKKNNQDSYFIYPGFMGAEENFYFGVCDGHGMVGHDVSGYLKSNLPYTLDNEIKKQIKNKNLNTIIKETFIDLNTKIVNNKNIDSQFSGSTCVTVIYTPEKLICANVGDSRAVMGRCEHGVWKGVDLSRDHKPCEEDEKQRILSRNGRIEPFRDENGEFIGPQRVWLKDEDIPGLAMSRSFGDEVAASVGCSSEPEIKEFQFNKNDAFFMLASDGIWEFISSDECVNIVKEYYLRNDFSGVCDYLTKESSKRWLKEEGVIDDITLIIVFFN